MIFIAVLNPVKANVIVGRIYGHSYIDLDKFNNDCFNNLQVQLPKKHKTVFFFLGNLQIDWLKYDQYSYLINFSNCFVSHVPTSYYITNHMKTIPKTLVDNIHSGVATSDTVLGKFTAAIPDHLPHFLIAPDLNKTNKENMDQLFVNFLIKFNSILDIHKRLKKDSREKLKLKNKQCIAPGLQN